MSPDSILRKVRAICLALPQARETVTFGHPTFQAGKRTFAVLEEYKGELCFVFKAELPTQQALIQSPRFFTAPYIGKHGWTSLRVGGRIDWGELSDLAQASYRLVASKAMLAALTRGRDGGSRSAKAAPTRARAGAAPRRRRASARPSGRR